VRFFMQDLMRIEKLQHSLIAWNLDACFVSKPVDLYYLTGIDMTSGALFVSRAHSVLIVDGRYFEKCKNNTTIEVVLDSKEARLELFTQRQFKNVKTIAFDSDSTSYYAYEQLHTFSEDVNKSKGENLTLVPRFRMIQEQRIIKDAKEQQKLRNACALCVQSYEYIITQLEEGMTEIDVARALEIYWLQHGGEGPAFEPIIAFGKNSCMPHYRPQNISLKNGDIVLIDIGVQVDHYCSDMTRVVFFGAPDPKLKEIALIVKLAQEKALSMCRPGIMTKELEAIAREEIEKSGYGDKFIHGLGHGIGLEIHEIPYLRKESAVPNISLKVGMAVTIEPGIYINNLGGVRIEDTVIVTETGCENLIDTSKDIRVIQAT
jgi:Xaa-Pro aminopeptidase